MKRITPEMALRAYEETGLKPMQGDYFPEKGCACGLGVMMQHIHPEINIEALDIHKFDVRVSATFGNSYKSGFAAGFDGVPEEFRGFMGTIEKAAYEDGRKVWEAVKHLAGVET